MFDWKKWGWLIFYAVIAVFMFLFIAEYRMVAVRLLFPLLFVSGGLYLMVSMFLTLVCSWTDCWGRVVYRWNSYYGRPIRPSSYSW